MQLALADLQRVVRFGRSRQNPLERGTLLQQWRLSQGGLDRGSLPAD
jgi:hypothetical protein